MNHYADSVQAHEAALPLARAAADPGAAATALLGLAYAAMFTGDAPRAAASPRKAWPRRGNPGIRSSSPRRCSS